MADENTERAQQSIPDEIAAAEAELAAAQERLAAARARALRTQPDGAAEGQGASHNAQGSSHGAAPNDAAGAAGQVPGADGAQAQASGAAEQGSPYFTYTSSAQPAGGPGAAGAPNGEGPAGAGYGCQPPFQTGYQQQGYQQPGYQPPYQPGYQPYQGAPYQPGYPAVTTKDHVAAGLLAIFLGVFGVHKFYLGYNTVGFIMLAVSILGGLFSIGIATAVMAIIAFIEGIIYLVKSQSEFEQIYVFGTREWF